MNNFDQLYSWFRSNFSASNPNQWNMNVSKRCLLGGPCASSEDHPWAWISCISIRPSFFSKGCPIL